jgi:flagellar biosynthesis/type III secretory pathway M-ring protein FliF/YscJ
MDLKWWEILLIALGGVIFLGIIIYIFIRRRKRKGAASTASTASTRISLLQRAKNAAAARRELTNSSNNMIKGRRAYLLGVKIKEDPRLKLKQGAQKWIEEEAYFRMQFEAGLKGEEFKKQVGSYETFSTH